ncbi:biotin/lipoyl-binding carrier protein [Siccirubricoccus sp. G192]|jgi:biotin carboxyl carrier protein|uniref:biotin/lipoyl-binding carrier protein n=1 Tax=Siccirubricoccus sp. G192 TaxID=2849651 RepID=UPI001C2C20DE|nr:biotin/lipoyl-binding carrier protein [Siccirubricoccus sp. G192]MBV1797324.1 biotin/lipoyl-binding carrier protein [Siccirubricoccus sp. G192]
MAGIKVVTEIAASVWKIEVAAGAAVEEGDTILLLESMKMEIPVTAPRAGRVASLLVEEGEQVAEGQTVAMLEG